MAANTGTSINAAQRRAISLDGIVSLAQNVVLQIQYPELQNVTVVTAKVNGRGR